MAPTVKPEEVTEKFQIVLEGCDGKLAEKPLTQAKKRQPLDIPEVKLPFPPTITAREVFEKTLLRKLTKSEGTARKSPNKFLIYRTVVVLELHRQNIHYSMTEVSGAIAKMWNNEPKAVKAEYTKLAAQVDELNRSHFGEFSRRKSHRKNHTKSLRVTDSHHPIISNNYYGDSMNNDLIPKMDPLSLSCNPCNYNNNLYQPYQLNTHQLCPPFYMPSTFHDNNFSFKQEPYNQVDNSSFIMPGFI
ncbi:hypothetical protein RclHR1_01900020 [Rhizophagus clarus]|uniref:HMG box domain-containing protein n=1 Tax=Rhizophagus clarus TaxID=94130 RepID=A0A2Z6QQ93_9GLOM|nr:hypothetical protein RclHR1_01900020 [Rhizophagus clarus]GES94093.1 hypothetical protein GLOIN_2v1500207 [Rhizophagus clarus]